MGAFQRPWRGFKTFSHTCVDYISAAYLHIDPPLLSKTHWPLIPVQFPVRQVQNAHCFVWLCTSNRDVEEEAVFLLHLKDSSSTHIQMDTAGVIKEGRKTVFAELSSALANLRCDSWHFLVSISSLLIMVLVLFLINAQTLTHTHSSP